MASAFSAIDPIAHDPIAQAEALIASGRAEEAARALHARLEAGRGGLLARLALVKALLAMGEKQDALLQAREASNLNPGIAVAALALGEALFAVDALPSAIAEFQRALRLDPSLTRARLMMARAWVEAGEAAQARRVLETLEPSADVEELMARVRAIETAPRSDPGYVRHLFDQFSADYDRRMLEQLHYSAPEILRQLADLVMPGRSDLKILDLGCGTGLAALQFAARASQLDGIDLSPAMLEKARARGLYRRLIVGDIQTAIEGDYDLILAADTLVYLGDLMPLFREVAGHLSRPGFFLFTTEAKKGKDFELGPKRRWRHGEAYLRATAEAAGLQVAGLMAASPRREAQEPVPGFAAALKLPL